jgi:hypothetical protein
MESRAADARAGFQRIHRDAGGYLILTPTPVKLQLDDSPLSADSPIAIDPPPKSTEFINIRRPSHPMPSRLVVSLRHTQLTSYALAVAASMRLSVLVSTTRLPLTNIPYVTCPSSASNDEHARPDTSKIYPVTTQLNHTLFETITSLDHGRFPASARMILALRTHLISAV